MRKMIMFIASIIALTVMAPGHATEHQREVDCLARNIYHEAASESEEGKAAVGIVTINRAKDKRFGNSICEVVHQKTVLVKTRSVAHVESVTHEKGWGLWKTTEEVHSVKQIIDKIPVCQFSWVCERNKQIKANDERWTQSKLVAENLLNGVYDTWQEKYAEAIYFHSTRIRPIWAKTKNVVERIGGHIFYAEK